MNITIEGTRYTITLTNVAAMWSGMSRAARLRVRATLTPARKPGAAPSYSEEQRAKVIKLRAGGMSLREIAAEMILSPQTVQRITRGLSRIGVTNE